MAKEYRIALKVDLGQSDAALARQAQALGRVPSQFKRIADTQEREAKRGADAQFVSFFKLDAQASKLATKLSDQAQKAADSQARAAQKTADAAQKAANSQIAAAQKTADAQTRSAKRAADAQQKEADRAFNASFVSSLKLSDQAEKLSSKLGREAQKAADAQQRENERAFKSSFVSSLKLSDQGEKLSSKLADQATRTADKQTQEAQRVQDRLTAMAGRRLTDEEVRASALGSINQRLNDKRVALATKTAEKERWAALSVKEKFGEVGETILSKVNPATIALGAATAVVGLAVAKVAEYWLEVSKGIQESIEFTNKYREALPENAALKGHLGDTTTELRDTLLFRSKTLQTSDQAKAFESGFLNTGVSSIGTRITQDEFDKFKVKAGKFQGAEGGTATTHGELAGRIPALMPLRKDATGKEIPVTADRAFAEEGRIFDVLSKGGSDFSSGSAQLLKNSSLTSSGLFRSIGQQAALQSMFSLNSPQSAGDLTNQFTRATVGNLGRMRGVGVEGSEKMGEYLKSLNATNQMDPIQIGKLISDDMKGQEGIEKAKGQQFNAFDFLKHRGVGNYEEAQSLLQFHASYQSGELGKFEAIGNAPASAAPLDKLIAASRADPMMQQRSVGITADMEKANYDRAHATADAYRRQIFEQMKAQKQITGSYDDVEKDVTQFKQNRLQNAVNQSLRRDAREIGAKIPDLPRYSMFSSQIALDRPVQEAIDAIQHDGVDPFAVSRRDVAARAKSNLDKSVQAEVPGRAGLAKKADADRVRGKIPDLLANPAQGLGQGLPPTVADKTQLGPLPPFGQGLGVMQPTGMEAVQSLLQQLVDLTQSQTDGQKEAAAKRAAIDAQKLVAISKQPPVQPLPAMGPGRIPTR